VDAQALDETEAMTVTVSDLAGNPSAPAVKTIIHDATAPSTPTVNALNTDDTTPVISGTADAGTQVTVEVAGATYILVADASGNWSVDTETVTPDSGTFSPNENGVNEVVVTSTDDAGNSSTDQTTGELVLDKNDNPIATAVSIDIDEDNTATGSIAANVTDPENHQLSFTLLTTPDAATEGTMVLNTDGSYVFTPVDNFNGTVMLTYEVCDNGNPSLCAQESITINVNAVNDFPVAVGEILSIDEDNSGSGTLADNVTDEEGHAVTFGLISAPDPSTEGTLTLNPDGTYSFVPVADFSGSLTFVYEVCDDGSPSRCSQASVAIEVSPVNDAPVANDDISSVNPGNTVVIPVLANDSDKENDQLTASQIVSNATNGTVVINADGTVSYTPNTGFDDGTDTFTYEVCDNGSPSECASALVTVSVPEQEFAPTAMDDMVVGNEDTDISGNVLTNDSDGNGDVLTVNTVPVTAPANGTLVLNADGTFTYTPNADFNGSDSFVYEVCDDSTPSLCSQASVSITVNAVNDGPEQIAAETITTPEDTPVSGTLADNVTDKEGDPLTFSVVAAPDVATQGVLSLNNDGTYTFQPVENFTGTVNFTYSACDNGSPKQCIEETATITIEAVNDAPTANNDLASVNPGNTVIINVVANDTDIEGNGISVSQVTVAPANGVAVVNADGTISYTPNVGFDDGTDTFTYEICDDGSTSQCSTAVVTVSVPEQELAPVANDDQFSTNEDVPVSGNILSNDSDGNNDALIVNTTPIVSPANGTLMLNTDGTFTYTPNAGFNGTDSFSYEVCDDATPSQCDQAIATITVNSVNDAPVLTKELVTVDEDGVVGGTLQDNVTDEDSNGFTFSLVSTTNPATEGVFTLNSDGTYSFTPADNFNGMLLITFEVCDNGNPSACSQETIEITIDPVNDAPVAINGGFTSNGITNSTGTLADFTDDPDGDVLSYAVVNDPTNGTVVVNTDGTYTYSPESGFAGTTSFTYEVCDGATPPLCDQATITITINSTDTDNDGVPDSAEDIDGDGDLSNDDSDGDGIPNYLDTDDDGDGVPTAEEDVDGDGNPANDNADGDGLPNYLDPDDDGDGLLTEDEDTNQDGDFTNDDCDGNNVANYLDAAYCDSDGDGIFDNDEDLNGDGDLYNDDCDGDTIPNFLDIDPCDTDGDGLDDGVEDANNDGNPYNDDCDENGIPDFQDPKPCDDELDTTPVITPNNDGFNDFMEIEGIENYPNNIVHIFNRWGNLVWETRGYDNTSNAFGGFNNYGLLTSNVSLPDGTYFVIIDRGDGSPLQKDFVVIKR
jgi:gliding motility-associated-like protein